MTFATLDIHALGPLIGVSMKDACTRAMAVAMDMRFNAVAYEKGRREDGRTDWVTQADLACQRIFVKLFTEQWVEPFGFGLIGEEEGLNIPCTRTDRDVYFVIDPIDGTSAYTRKQSTGFGPMCALVVDEEVVAVCIGDANSGELYYYRPGSDKTHRLVSMGQRRQVVELQIDVERTLESQYLLMRSLPRKHSPLAQELLEEARELRQDPLFLDAEMASGSIGLSMARLWKGEVGACLLRERMVTPWDNIPVLGMCRRLGFKFWMIEINERKIGLCSPKPNKTKIELPQTRELLVIHESRLDELAHWAAMRNITLWPQN